MDPKRWQEVERLFNAALEQDPEQRERFLNEACAGDEPLREEVESLLSNSEPSGPLEAPAMEIMAERIASDGEAAEGTTGVIGKTLGRYLISRALGHGGMGEVFQADDLTLGRKVALKFLPEAFTGNPERMARFEREAKLLASLNHPNIAAIYGLEQAEGKRFLVLELVDGETLAQRLGKGPLPIEDALGLCRQIAKALEAAHQQGVIHRDLKPENVMISPGDRIKLLDFGLAKALAPETQNFDSRHSPTITETMTQPGVILGTAAYMSPEQAKGKAVDRRTDIWALGCILFECLTHKRAFEGETVTETLAAILKNDPDWEALPQSTPPNIRLVLSRCLEKDMARRFHHAHDLSILLEDAPEIDAAVNSRRQPLWLTWLLAAALIVTVTVSAWMGFKRQSPADAPALFRFSLLPPGNANIGSFSLSPDGRWLAFSAGNSSKSHLWLRALDALEARMLPGTNGASAPFWSPDSNSIGFFDGYRIKKADVSGGPVQVICEETQLWDCSWNRDGDIIFNGSGTGLKQVSAAGGQVSLLTTADSARQETDHAYPSFLPDGNHFVYTINSRHREIKGIYLGSLKGDVKRRLIPNAASVSYVASSSGGAGYLIFHREEALLAQPFDSRELKLTGRPFMVAENAGAFSASYNGVLVLGHDSTRRNLSLRKYFWVDRNGRQTGSLGAEAGPKNPRFSPDQKLIVADRIDANMSTDLWLYDAQTGRAERFTFDPSLDIAPVWSPDGASIVFSSSRNSTGNGLYQKPARGVGSEELIFESRDWKIPTSWSSDGSLLIYTVNDRDIWVLPLKGDRKPFPFLDTEDSESAGQLSPDGRWLVYQSDESGRNEIYIQSFPKAGRKRQISFEGGLNPQWRADGKELFYLAEGKLLAVRIKTTTMGEIDFDPAVPLFEYPSDAWKVYTVSSDGHRFLITQTENGLPAPLTVILNWTSLLKK